MKYTNIVGLDGKYVKSYATEIALLRAMEKLGVNQVCHQTVRMPNGRWTVLIIGFHQHLLGSGFAQIS